MIKRFAAQNLGLFEKCEVDLEPFTVFIGKNSTGKTTVLRAIRTLAILTRLPLYPGKSRRLISLSPTMTLEDLFGDLSKPLVLSVDVESDAGQGSYSVEFTRDPLAEVVEVTGETASWRGTNSTFEYDARRDAFDFDFRGTKVTAGLPRNSTLPYLAFPFYRERAPEGLKLAPLYEIMTAFTPFHVFRLSPAAIAMPADPTAEVSHDGRGLAAELDRILGSDRRTFDKIVADLREAFPHIVDLKIETRTHASRGAQKALAFEVRGNRVIPAEAESDGVLLTLAYSWLANTGKTGVGVEEPETGAYPRLVYDRVATLRALAERGVQVIATTQSPVLLTAVGRSDDVRIFQQDNSGKACVVAAGDGWVQDTIHRHLEWTVTNER
ncbi:MAG TPA: AAA family ATPase [Longimicrobiales bacterium]